MPAYLCKCNETGEETWVAAGNEKSAREKASKMLNSKNVIKITTVVLLVNTSILAGRDTRSRRTGHLVFLRTATICSFRMAHRFK